MKDEKTDKLSGEEQQLPGNIQIARVDNGWLVGVHTPRTMDYGCGPSKQYVFGDASSLSRALEHLVLGHAPNWVLDAWETKRRMQYADALEKIRANGDAFGACIGDDIGDLLVRHINRTIQEFKFKKK
jgi:hypothetical protein